VAQIAEEQTFAAKAVICRDGEDGDCLYVIVSGSVQIQKRGLELAVLTRANSLGEMAVLDSSPRSADAIAMEETVVLRVGQEQFLETMQSNSRIMQSVVRMLLTRLRIMDEHLASNASVATGGRSA
jgi:CRP/FNR family transcriptional regulator, cyclic AMP receptor protein